MEALPDTFDLIVIGTGFTESCVAAAASRIGKSVLHIDPNEYYGGAWASFGLDALIKTLEGSTSNAAQLRNAGVEWHCADALSAEQETQQSSSDAYTTRQQLLAHTRRFNLDLCPKLLYAHGELVKLLISSNICRYGEFRAVDHVLTLFNNELLSVPCTRSDVFNSKPISIIEKRLLMKVLTICMSYGEDKAMEDEAEYQHSNFGAYLEEQKLTAKLSTCILQAIAMCSADTAFAEGMQRIKKFIDSLGRYGNTPFLFPMYGNGEVPQCFCRLCAVFGGTYCLKRLVSEVRVEADTQLVTIQLAADDKVIRAKHLVSSHDNLPAQLLGSAAIVNALSRCILISNAPVGDAELNAGGGGVNLLRLLSGAREAIFVQLSHYAGTCPKGCFVFHLTTPAISDDPRQDLQPFLAQILTAPHFAGNLLFSAYFTLTALESSTNAVSSPIFITAAPIYEMDYDANIQNAKEIFNKLYAAEAAEFLPRAPDPEEIVVDGEDPSALSANSLPDDLREQLQQLTVDMQVDEAAQQHMDTE